MAAIIDFRSKKVAIFDLQVTLLPTKIQINWPIRPEKVVQTHFQDSRRCRSLGFQIGKILSYFSIYKSPREFLSSFESIGHLVQEQFKYIFKTVAILDFQSKLF